MASADNSSPPPSRPVPSPRQVKPTPTPRARTKVTPAVTPEDDVMQSISFKSPLADDAIFVPSLGIKERKSLPTSRVIINSSESYVDMRPVKSMYENVTLSSLPPNIPPPPLPDESMYDQPKTPTRYQEISDNNLDIINSNFTSENSSRSSSDSYENFDPTLLRSKTNDHVKRKPTESVLFHFDPLYENIFMSGANGECNDTLEDIFNINIKIPANTSNGDVASGFDPISTIVEEEEDKRLSHENVENNTPVRTLVENTYDIPEGVENATCLDTGYGRIFPASKTANISTEDEDNDSEDIPPPTPMRMDSIPREDFTKIEPPILSASKPSIRRVSSLDIEKSDDKKSSPKIGRFKSMKNFTKNILQKQAPSTVSSLLLGTKPMGRPSFSEVNTSVAYTGVLVQPGRDKTEWGVTLTKGFIRWTSEKGGTHEFQIQNLTNIAAFNPAAASSSQSTPLYCMELSSLNVRGAHQLQLFASPLANQRSTWMQRIVESATSVFPPHLTKEFTRAGWLNIKEGVSGSWMPCWLLLRHRELHYCVQPGTVLDADLRKARCILPQTSGGLLDSTGCILVELHGRSLYLQAVNDRDTNRWGHSIRAAALNNGVLLSEQQLTKDNVPVIVEKCVNFVAQQGAVSEGIYRRSGVSSTISKLLAEFKKDAWSVQLTRTTYSEHEVATALKRFFKDLPESLIPPDLTPQLCRVAMKSYADEEKVIRYRALLQQLTPIHYVTSRKLFGHLHFLHLESKRNLMNARNLASIWGISLMHQMPMDMVGEGQSKVVADLITLYPKLYDVAETEMAREMKMLSFLEKFHSAAPSQKPLGRPSGDLRVWVYIGKPGSTETVQISVGPQKTAGQICEELGRGPDHILQEYVLGGALARPMHPSEKVLDAVVRWGYWDEQDRKDNQLVLAPCKLYEDIKPLAKPPLVACSELKFADTRSKNFKTCVFELQQAKLSYYKDRKLLMKFEWKIEDIVWYLGHEPKRDPMTKWSITFITRQNKPNRSREQPWFGNTLAGNIDEEMEHWCAAMFLAEYPEGL